MDLKRDKYSPFISSKISIDKKGQDIEMNLKLTKNTKKLNLSTTISGNVVDKLKNPIDNAIVNLMDENFNPLTYVTTGENGKYLMNDIPYSDSYNLIATANGKLISQANNFSISSQQNLEFNFVLLDDPNALLGIISGKVQNDNNPLLGAIVSLYTIDEDKKNLISITYSDVSGIYTFTELPLGNYSIGISALGYMQFQMPVSVNSGEIISVKSNLSVDPKASDGIISGIIKDSTNLQISDAYVILYRVEDNEDLTPISVTTTDKNGLYVFINVSTGNYLIKTNDFELIELVSLGNSISSNKEATTSITSSTIPKNNLNNISNIIINTTDKGVDINKFNFNGEWNYVIGAAWTNDINATFSLKFKGISITLMGIKDPNHGIYEISIDNGIVKEIDGYSSNRTEIISIFDSGLLNYGDHILNFNLKGINLHGGRPDGQINYAIVNLGIQYEQKIVYYNLSEGILENGAQLGTGASAKYVSNIGGMLDGSASVSVYSLNDLHYKLSIIYRQDDDVKKFIKVDINGINTGSIYNVIPANPGKTTLNVKLKSGENIIKIHGDGKNFAPDLGILYISKINPVTSVVLGENNYDITAGFLSGGATNGKGSSSKYISYLGGTNNGEVTITVNVLTLGIYKLAINYINKENYTKQLKIDVNGINTGTIYSLAPANPGIFNTVILLNSGDNKLKFYGNNMQKAPDLGIAAIKSIENMLSMANLSNGAEKNNSNIITELGGINDGTATINYNASISGEYYMFIMVKGVQCKLSIDINGINTGIIYDISESSVVLKVYNVKFIEGNNKIEFHGNGIDLAPDLYYLNIKF